MPLLGKEAEGGQHGFNDSIAKYSAVFLILGV